MDSLKKEMRQYTNIFRKNKWVYLAHIIFSIVLSFGFRFNIISSITSLLIIGLIIPTSYFNNMVLIVSQLLLSMTIISGVINLNIHMLFKFTPDVLAFIIFIKLIYYVFYKKIKVNKFLVISFIALLTVNIVNYLILKNELLPFLCGIRNYYIYYVSFLGYVYLPMDKGAIDKIIKYLIVFAFLQIPITIVQYFYYKKNAKSLGIFLWQDYVAGTFGKCLNGDLGFLIIVVCTLFICLYVDKKIQLKKMPVLLLFIIPIVLGEIKIVILVMPIIIIVICLSKLSKRMIKVLLISMCIIGVSFLSLLYKYPEYKKMFSADYIKYYAYDIGYGNYKLNRLSAPVYVNNNILNSTSHKLTGIGIGNASDNGFNIFNSSFQKSNSELGANLFFASKYLLENGWIGLIIFLGILFWIFSRSFKLSHIEDYKTYSLFIKGIAIAIIIYLFYGLSVFNLTSGFLMWFLMGTIVRMYNEQK